MKALLAAALCAILGAMLLCVPGVRFSVYVCWSVGALFLIWHVLVRMEKKYRAAKVCKRIFLVSVFALFVLLASLEVLILSYGEGGYPEEEVQAVIVLGAGVNGETPSAALRSRIDAAETYLKGWDHGKIPVVLSGGQGSGESISEAEAMYRALVPSFPEGGSVTLLREDASTSTAENFAFSKELLIRSGLDTEEAVIAVVTNDFHCFRARLIAQREGLTVVFVPAELPWWWLTANYYLRESFALVKTALFD